MDIKQLLPLASTKSGVSRGKEKAFTGLLSQAGMSTQRVKVHLDDLWVLRAVKG